MEEDETCQQQKITEFNSGISTYEILEIAVIKVDGGEEKLYSQVNSVATSDVVGVSVEQTCSILKRTSKDCSQSFSLDTKISCIAICPEGDFILIGSQNGSVSVFYCPLNKCVFTRSLAGPNVDEDFAICGAVISPVDPNTETCDIFICTRQGCVFHLSKVDLNLLRTELNKGDVDSDTFNVLSNIDKFEVPLFSCNNFSYSYLDGRNLFMIAGDGATIISKESEQHFEILHFMEKDSFLGGQIIKSAISADHRYVVVLDELKNLHLICLETFIIIGHWDENMIDDFILFENVESSRYRAFSTIGEIDLKMCIKIVIDEKFYLQLHSLPSFDVIYKVPVSSETYLVNPSFNLDNVLYLEQEKIESTEHKLSVFGVFETCPSLRLQRLIGKGQFDEALLFAKSFKLDVELVYKGKIAVLVQQLNQTSHLDGSSSVKDLKESLYECLDNISDFNLVITMCVEATLEHLCDKKELLMFAKSIAKRNFNFDSAVLTNLFETSRRLETFDLLNEDESWRPLWERFKATNLWEELVFSLRNEHISTVSLIWARHCEELILSVNDNDVICFLESIQKIHSFDKLREWLRRSFFPLVLMKVKGAIEVSASWVIYCCQMMEFNDADSWPGNAISFANMFIDVCQELYSSLSLESLNYSIDLAILMCREAASESLSLFRQFRLLLDNLLDLEQLQLNFTCKISLANYSQEEKHIVVYHLLEEIECANIPDFVTNFLTPFAKNYSLDVDSLLENYIEEVLKQTEIDWRYWEEAPWEKQVVAILKCIHSDDYRLQSLCQVLKEAPVPWTAAIDELVNESLKTNHSLVNSIKNEKDCVPRRVIMRKYGYNIHNNLDSQTGYALIYYILTTEENRIAIDDALIISEAIHADSVDVYFFRLRHFIKTKKLLEFYQFLEEIPESVAVPCCKRLAMLTSGLNEDICNREESIYERLNFTSAAIYGLQYLQNHVSPIEFEDYAELLNNFLALSKIQRFGVVMPLDKLTSTENSKLILKDCIENFIFNETLSFKDFPKIPDSFICERKVCNGKPTLRDLFWIGNILKFPVQLTAEMIVSSALNLNKLNIAVDACVILCSDGVQDHTLTGGVVIRVMGRLCSNARHIKTSIWTYFDQLNSALAEAVIKCHSEHVHPLTSAIRWGHFVKQILRVCDINVDLSQFLNQDSYNNWSYSFIFQEAAVHLESEKILTLVGGTIEELFTGESFLISMNDSSLSSLQMQFENMIEYLQSRGRILLGSYVNSVNLDVICYQNFRNEEHMSALSKVCKRSASLNVLILETLFRQKKLDHMLTLGNMMSLTKNSAMSFLKLIEKKFGHDFGKLFVVATLGIEVASRWSMYDAVCYYKDLLIEAKWGEKLNRYHIRYKDYFRKSPSEKLRLTPVLANHKRISLTFIKEFATAFKMREVKMYEILLRDLLTSRRDNESNNKKSLTEVLNLCSIIVQEMLSEESLLRTLNAVFSKIDPYNYEAVEFVLRSMLQIPGISDSDFEIAQTVNNSLRLLEFLMSYERKDKPSDFEFTLGLEINSEEYNRGRAICLKRLPFHYLFEPPRARKIIESELLPETVNLWLEMSTLLSISRNDMIMITISNLIRRVYSTSDSSKLMSEQYLIENSTTKYIFVTVHNLINCIDDFEKATACLISIFKSLPPGANKIIALEIAMEISEKWWESSKNEKAASTLNIFKAMHRNLFIDQFLHKYQLNIACNLKDDPEEMIGCILEHESAVSRYWFKSCRHPDLYKACRKISDYFKLNFDKTCSMLLYKWLVPPEFASGNLLDESIMIDLNSSYLRDNLNETPTNKGNIEMAIYLLHQMKSKEVTGYLVSLVQSNSSSIKNADKLKYLMCLLHTEDTRSLLLHLGQTMDEIRTLAKQFYCNSELETIGLSCSIMNTEEVATTNIIIHLIQKFGQKSTAVLFAADMSLENKIYNVVVWDNILKRMTSMKLIKPLTRIVCALSAFPEIMTSQAYIEAWRVVLSHDEEDENSCGLSKLILIQRCPVFIDLDLLSLADVYKEASLPVLAIECYMRSSNSHDLIKNFVSLTKPEDILTHAIALFEHVGNLYHMSELLNVIFEAFVSNHIWRNLLSGSYGQWIKDNILNESNLKGIVSHVAKKEMWNECVGLIQLNAEIDTNLSLKEHDSDTGSTKEVLAEKDLVEKYLIKTSY